MSIDNQLTLSSLDCQDNSVFRVAITGHRPPGIGGYDKFAERRLWVRNSIYEVILGIKNDENMYPGKELRLASGMAQGVDWEAASAALALGIPVDGFLVRSREYQSSRWPKKVRKLWYNLLDAVLNNDGILDLDSRDFHERDRKLVDSCHLGISVLNYSNILNKKGGTFYTTKYMEKNNLNIIRITPDKETIVYPR